MDREHVRPGGTAGGAVGAGSAAGRPPMITDRLHDWLFRRTLPYWRDHGIDRAAGGFHEALDLARRPASDDGKRVMVQARQIYAFSQATLLDALEDRKSTRLNSSH